MSKQKSNRKRLNWNICRKISILKSKHWPLRNKILRNVNLISKNLTEKLVTWNSRSKVWKIMMRISHPFEMSKNNFMKKWDLCKIKWCSMNIRCLILSTKIQNLASIVKKFMEKFSHWSKLLRTDLSNHLNL